MPTVTIVQGPTVTWDQQMQFPYLRPNDVPPVNIASPMDRYLFSNGNAIQATLGNREFMRMNVSSGGTAFGQVVGGGPPYMRIGSLAAGDFRIHGTDGAHGQVNTGTLGAMAAGSELMSSTKGYWMRILMRCTVGTPGIKSGFLFMPITNAAIWAWPDQIVGAGNRGGFGFVGDAAGQFTYRSYDRTGVALVRETIALPAHTISDWHLAEFFFFSARPGVAASVEILWDGVLVGTRNWLGALLEDYALPTEQYFCGVCGGGANSEMHFTSMHMRSGAYDRAGVPIP